MVNKSASRHGLLCQAETDLFHARQRLAWSSPGRNPCPPGANAMTECRLSFFSSTFDIQIPSRTWSLAQFRQYLVQTFGPRVAHMAFRNMETVIVETLLVAEPSLVADFAQYAHPFEDPYR